MTAPKDKSTTPAPPPDDDNITTIHIGQGGTGSNNTGPATARAGGGGQGVPGPIYASVAAGQGGGGSGGANESSDPYAHLPAHLRDIAHWWVGQAEVDAEEVIAKAQEYDGIDLEIMGMAMSGLLPEGLDAKTARMAGLEMAVAFYALGKIARTFGAYRNGTIPRDDTWKDLHIYANMVRRIRLTGFWT